MTLRPLTPVEKGLSDEAPQEAAMAEYSNREHFIPIRKTDLVDLLRHHSRLERRDEDQFRQFCHRLEATLHCEYYSRLEELKNAYAFFDPDSDTQPLHPVTLEERERQIGGLFDKFVALLERANFTRVSREDFSHALEGASDWGINLAVNFDVFDRLEIFARGDVIGHRTRRTWKNWMRSEEVAVPVYQRLIVILRLRPQHQPEKYIDADSVYIKIFKDIPKLDLEMLLPGTRVKLSLSDRGKIVLPPLGGLAYTAWKLLQGALVVAITGAYDLLALAGLLSGTIGYGIRSFFGYLQTKQKYQLNLTQSLYYQNLDNNAGALFRLLNEAEEQEFREAVLAYFFLLTHAGAVGWHRDHLDDAIEDFLEQSARIKVDFEIGDAVDKLVHFQLIREQRDGLLHAVSLPEALAALGRVWQSSFQDFTIHESILHMHVKPEGGKPNPTSTVPLRPAPLRPASEAS